MHPPLYREALRHSSQFALCHKTLWLFGLFAGALGQTGFLDFFLTLERGSREAVLSSGWWKLPHLLIESFRESGFVMPFEGWIWLGWLGVIAVGGVFLFLLLSLLSQGALIHAAAQSVRGDKIDSDAAWIAGVRHIGRLFFLNLCRKAVILLLASFLGWAAFNALVQPAAIDRALFVLLFFLSVLTGAVVSFLVLYTACYIVVEEYSLPQALLAAWQLFTRHWIVSLEVAGMLIALQVGAALLAMASLIFFFLPSAFVWGAAIAFGSRALFVAGTLLGTILVLAALLLISSLFTMMATSLSTYLFMKMHREGVKSRVVHLLTHRL